MDDIQHKIITSLSEKKDVKPETLDFELYEYVDAESVEQVVTHPGSDAVVSFSVDDFAVRVDSDCSVQVAQTFQGLQS